MDYNKADVVCSDAVPDFVGTRFVDHMNSVNLNNLIVDFCFKTLKPGGNLLMKIIMGPAEERLQKSILMQFESVQRVKPNASRSESKEIYLLCKNYGHSQDKFALKLQDIEKKFKLVESQRLDAK